MRRGALRFGSARNRSMPTAAALLRTFKTFGLSLPGTQPKAPWPGHDDVAVNDKTFAYLSIEGGHIVPGPAGDHAGDKAIRLARHVAPRWRLQATNRHCDAGVRVSMLRPRFM